MSERTTQTQNEIIIQHLMLGNTMTLLDGLKVAKTFKLSTRMSEISRLGWSFHKDKVDVGGKRVMSYWMDAFDRACNNVNFR